MTSLRSTVSVQHKASRRAMIRRTVAFDLACRAQFLSDRVLPILRKTEDPSLQPPIRASS